MSMEAVQTKTGRFEVEDVEYLRHGDKPLFIRCCRPHGAGPFPVMIELHGGVWTENDRTRANPSGCVRLGRHRGGVARLPARPRRLSALARRHQLRDPLGEGARHAVQHPAGPCRHLRLVERRASGDAGRNAARRSAICRDPAAGGFAGGRRERAQRRMFWPVINPLAAQSRCACASAPKARPGPPRTMKPAWLFWVNEENMLDGSPVLAVQRGEKVVMPPALWMQGRTA